MDRLLVLKQQLNHFKGISMTLPNPGVYGVAMGGICQCIPDRDTRLAFYRWVWNDNTIAGAATLQSWQKHALRLWAAPMRNNTDTDWVYDRQFLTDCLIIKSTFGGKKDG